MKMLAFIPARGGSKGIHNKNLTLLTGKPLIQYTIEAAQQAKRIDRIFLSSESAEIRSFGRACGLSVEYERPLELAQDETSMVDTVLHGLDWLEACGQRFEALLLLQPTCPLRLARHIDEAITRFQNSDADSLISVQEMSESPYECLTAETAGKWSWLRRPPAGVSRRQDYPQRFFFMNGALYISRIEALRKTRCLTQEGTSLLYEMAPCFGVDIDGPVDLRYAEFLLRTS